MGTPGPIRVVIADDQQLFREGLRLILSREEGIAVVGDAAHGFQTIDVVNRLHPDIVLLDISISGMDVIEVIVSLKQRGSATKSLMLTSTNDEALLFKALKAGAKGCLSKDASAPDLLKAIQAVHHGELWVERKLMARFFDVVGLADVDGEDRSEKSQGSLTTREQEVLHFLASGDTNKEIAQALFISEKTVKNHLNRIFRKLHVTRRLQAALYAVHRGPRKDSLPTASHPLVPFQPIASSTGKARSSQETGQGS